MRKELKDSQVERESINIPERTSRSLFRFWLDAFREMGPDRLLLLLAAALAFISGLLQTILLYLMAVLAVALAGGNSTTTIGRGPLEVVDASAEQIVLIAAIIVVILIAVAVPMSRTLASINARAISRARSRLIRAHAASSWAYRTSEREGYFAQIVGEYCTRNEQMVQQLGTVILAGCQMLTLILGAVVASPIAALISIIGLTATGLSLRPLSRRVRHGSLKNAVRSRSVVSDVQQGTRLGIEITSYNVGEVVADDLAHRVDLAADQLRRVRFLSRLVPILYQYGALGVVLAVVGIMSLVADGGVAPIAPVILLLIRALSYLKQLVTATQNGSELAPYVEAVQAEIATLEAHRATEGDTALAGFKWLELRDLSFEYLPDTPVLSGVDLRIEAGDILGLVGPSGRGKTTLTLLLLRLLEPTTGSIVVDDVDLHRVGTGSWARLVAFVPQENKLILGTVAENIAFYRSGFSRDDIVTAARKAHIDDDISELALGYDTLIGPGAQSLSGGQCQRLGIARALLGRPELLILDEPTSALDGRSETLIRQTLSEIAGETTIVLVAHRPATLEVCTRVYEVDNGTVRTKVRAPAPG